MLLYGGIREEIAGSAHTPWKGKSSKGPYKSIGWCTDLLLPGQPQYPMAMGWLRGQPVTPSAPRAAEQLRAGRVQASSYPDTLRFRFPLFPSYYGNWQI